MKGITVCTRTYFGLLLSAILFTGFFTGCSGGGGGGDTTNTTYYSLGGTVTGLGGSGLALQNNAGDDLVISANGSFTFTTAIVNASSYAVTIATQPAGQTCTVTNGGGIMAGADVTNVAISCVYNYTLSGTVTGLAGSGLVLRNNGGDDRAISTNGSFTFATAIADGSSYAVTIATQPIGQTCTVTNGSGSMAGANVIDIVVQCGPQAVTFAVSATQPKVLTFSWGDVGAHHYKLLKNPDGVSGYTQVGADITTTSVNEEIPVHLTGWVNARYVVQSCDAGGVCTDSAPITATSAMLDAIGYFKASNTEAGDWFGYRVTLAADGNTLAVGAWQEDSAATGINGDQADNTVDKAGAVYVFVRSGNTWSQQAYLKASNTGVWNYFGKSLALSSDGNTLAVGAEGEGGSWVGAAYVFVRSGATWSQQAYIKASNAEAGDWFGSDVALSADGNTLAVGAYLENSSATVINGNQSDNNAADAGAVYVFVRSRAAWSQQAYIKASNTEAGDYFGYRVALAGDGNTLAVGAFHEDSAATGINGSESDNGAADAGAVYVFVRSGTTWSQEAYIKASNTEASDWFGRSVALSTDGNTLAVGAYGEDSAATGVNGTQSNNSAGTAGAVYVFVRSGAAWSQQAYVKASNPGPNHWFGESIALSADGNTLAVGATGEQSTATGINGDQTAINPYASYGAVYVFVRSGATWSQKAYVKASNMGAGDIFGRSVALAGDANTLAVGADGEDSAATGIDGNQADNSVTDAGAIYLY